MIVKFWCYKCGALISGENLVVDEAVKCEKCDSLNQVPVDAMKSNAEPGFWTRSIAKVRNTKNYRVGTKGEKIARKYRRIDIIFNILIFVVIDILIRYLWQDFKYHYILSWIISAVISYTINVLRKEEFESTPETALESDERRLAFIRKDFDNNQKEK